MHEQDSANLIRDRAIRLFSFLKELAQLKSTTVRDLAAYDQVIWFHTIPEYKDCFSILSPESDSVQDNVWLEIKKPPEPKRPQPPSLCLEWLEDDADADLLAEPCLKDEIPAPNSGFSLQSHEPGYSPPTIRLADHPEILQEWERYVHDSWVLWSEVYERWKRANEIYFRLFSIHQQMKKLGERYELLVGLGLLMWETPSNQIIRRHVLVGDASLIFDADRAKFEVQAAPEGVKLRFETEMIDQKYLPPLDEQRTLESMISLVEESPWSKDDIDKVLRSFVHSIGPEGTYSDALIPLDKPPKKPALIFAPAIILRTRTQRSQIQCLGNIIEQIDQGGDIPSGIGILCEDFESSEEYDEDRQTIDTQVIDETLYLPLPTNDEQRQIIQRIRSQDGILVQGPPGTGKSHTIANTICHLLAQGKRVLVTSQTPRALRVLKEKLPKEIAPLCVTLLGNDQAARQDLEESVSGISQRYSDWDAAKNQTLIATLETHLYELRKEQANTERLLRERREISTYRHEVAEGNYEGTAQEIARRVTLEESRFAWLAGGIGNGEVCPLSNDEFRELLRLYRDLSESYCSELTKEIVSRDSIPDLSSFVKMIDDEKKAKQDLAEHEARRDSLCCRVLRQVPEKDIKSLRKAISDLVTATSSVKRGFTWTQQAISDVLIGNDAPWKAIYDFMIEHLGGLKEKATIVQGLDVELPEHVPRKKLLADTLDLVNHLETGGSMGWMMFAPKVVRQNRYIPKQVRVNGYPCASLERLRLLTTYLETLDEVDLLWSALEGIDQRKEGSVLLQVGRLQERLDTLEEVLGLEKYLVLTKQYLKAVAALPEPRWYRAEELEEIIADIQTIEYEHAFNNVVAILEHVIQNVRIVQSSTRSHSLNQEVLNALENRDAQSLARCLEKVESFEKGRATLSRREALYERLSKVTPKVAQQLQDTFTDNLWDERALGFEEAWKWSLADRWVKSFGKEHDEASLETDLKRLSTDEGKTISKLAAARAWDNCLHSLTNSRRNNLIAWATAMKKIGKGTGKRAPIYRKQAQEYMDNCKDAIPAWIMPLYRVFETIRPEPEAFDVVIIDEASQTGPEGLMLGYLGKQCIVVGDSDQIAPEAVGIDQSAVDTLVKRYLEGIPFMGLYNPQTSLFDFANILFSGKIVLREHFRCMPEIIQFSNELCYKATPLKPLRQYPPKRLEPILVRHVKTGFREGSTAYALNRPEADALIEAVIEMCSSKEYDGKTIGVISLQGEAQAKYIENNLLTRLNPEDLESRRIICGDAYAFQGDERDIILLSMVAAPNERIGALVREADKRRFNVAASRAKDQVVLFYTSGLSDLHLECMRHKLLEYYLNPTRKSYEVDLSKCESQFERDVCQAIISKEYKVIPQYVVAEYRIDLVVEGPRSQLAVECDGDQWHGIEQYESDVARQRILERCGWRFWRIRGHEYYRSPVDSLEPLWKTLAEMGITPKGASKEECATDAQEGDIPVATEIDVCPDGTAQLKDRVGLKLQEGVKDKNTDDEKGTPEHEAGRRQEQRLRDITRVVDSEIYNYSVEYFFSLAHWAKDNRKLASWERNLAFKVGRYIQQGWKITQKMEHQTLRIIREAVKAGFSEGKSKT